MFSFPKKNIEDIIFNYVFMHISIVAKKQTGISQFCFFSLFFLAFCFLQFFVPKFHFNFTLKEKHKKGEKMIIFINLLNMVFLIIISIITAGVLFAMSAWERYVRMCVSNTHTHTHICFCICAYFSQHFSPTFLYRKKSTKNNKKSKLTWQQKRNKNTKCYENQFTHSSSSHRLC